MKNSILILGLLLSFNLFGQNLTKKELRYIPKDFNESLTQLDKIIPDSTKMKKGYRYQKIYEVFVGTREF